MTEKTSTESRIVLGDPVPRFSAPLITGGSFDLHVGAGRWVVLSFLGSPDNPRVDVELANLLRQADLFGDDHLIVGCVFTEPPADIAKFAAAGGKPPDVSSQMGGDARLSHRMASGCPGRPSAPAT